MAKIYDESAIQVLKGLDQVRKRPVMYMGERGDNMIWRMVKEAVDNCVDEHLAERNNYIEVFVDTKANFYLIRDKAEGIPVGIHKTEKKSTLEVVMTQLHAGGKFNDKNYKFSAGTHGLGISATNALSTMFKVWTFRDNAWWHQEYSEGKPKFSVKKVNIDKSILTKLKDKSKKGTIICFVPDQTIVSKDSKIDAVLNRKLFIYWMRDLANLNKGLNIHINVDGKEFDFVNKIGPELILKGIEKSLDVTRVGKTFIFDTDKCTCAFAFSDYIENDGIRSYVCNSPTKNGGTHYKGLLNVLAKALSSHASKRDKFSNKDLLNGFIGILNWRMSEPEFTSQVKDELDSNVTKEVEALLNDPITAFFNKNKKLAKDIIKRAVKITASKEQYKKVLKSLSEVKKTSKRSLLPNILASAVKAKADKRELYLCEGDSAFGTCKQARDASFQEVMKLKGKPINAMRSPIEKVLSHEVIQHLIIALDIDTEHTKRGSKTFLIDNLRVKDVFLLADGDEDGHHINLLMVAFFYKFLPDFIKAGRLHVIDAPLFFAFYKNKRYMGSTFQDCFKQLPKGAPKHCVIRAKGWGEISSEALSEVAFNVNTRSYITIDLPAAQNLLERYESIVCSDTSVRKEILGL